MLIKESVERCDNPDKIDPSRVSIVLIELCISFFFSISFFICGEIKKHAMA